MEVKMINPQIDIQEDKIKIQFENIKLKSQIYKHGYHNITTPRPITQDTTDDVGIYLYTPQRTRSEIAYFYLDYISITKETNAPREEDWLKTLRRNTTLHFKTRQNDPLTLPLTDINNIKSFYEDYFYLFNTRYIKKHTAHMDNHFYEFIALALYVIYACYADILYTFVTGDDAITATINTTNPEDEQYDVLVSLINNRTGKKPETGTVTFYLNNELVYTGDVATLNEQYSEIPYHITTTDEQTFRINYTLDEYTSEIEYIIPYHVQGVNIIAENITATVGDEITIPVTVKGAEDESLVNEGKLIFKLNGKTIKDDENKALYVPVVNGTATFQLDEVLSSKDHKVTIMYHGEKFYTNNQTSITLTVERGDIKVNLNSTPIVTVDGIVIVDGSITETDNTPLISPPEIAYKLYGKTTILSLLEGGILPSPVKLVDLGVSQAGNPIEFYVVASLTKYYNLLRETINCTVESEPLWDVTYSNGSLIVTTTGFIDGQTVDVTVDDTPLGTVTINEGTGGINYEGSGTITVTLTATLTNNREYTKSFTLNL